MTVDYTQPDVLRTAVQMATDKHWQLYNYDPEHGRAYLTCPATAGPNHVLHGLLTLFTGLLWLPVWVIVALTVHARPARYLMIEVRGGQVIYSES